MPIPSDADRKDKLDAELDRLASRGCRIISRGNQGARVEDSNHRIFVVYIDHKGKVVVRRMSSGWPTKKKILVGGGVLFGVLFTIGAIASALDFQNSPSPASPTGVRSSLIDITPQPESARSTPTGSIKAAINVTPVSREGYTLSDFVLCDGIRLTKAISWGQAPGRADSGDPRVSGQLEIGDRIHILTPNPRDGEVRVQVYTHDSRSVGNTADRVWISWDKIDQAGPENVLVCQD